MKGANPGQGKRLTATPGGNKVKSYKQNVSALGPGVKPYGGTKGGDNLSRPKGFDPK